MKFANELIAWKGPNSQTIMTVECMTHNFTLKVWYSIMPSIKIRDGRFQIFKKI